MKFKGGFVLACFLLFLLSVGFASALDLKVEKIEKAPVIISELENPALFDFIITNNGAAEAVEIYSLVGVSFEPKGSFGLPHGESTREVSVYPGESAREREGNYAFEYQIKGDGPDIFKDRLTVKIVKLGNVLSIEPQAISYGDRNAVIKVRNVQNIVLDKADLSMSSVFFDGKKEISLEPFESVEITLPMKSSGVKDLAAGAYVVSSILEFEGISANIENTVSYREKQDIVMEKTGEGAIVRTTTIKRTNEGNLAVADKIELTKNIVTRLFTSFSVEPLSRERRGLFVYYRWEKDIAPGDSWSVEIKTNYTLPFILIILIVFSAAAVYAYSRTSLVVKKRCSFVKTRGGEFALKVILHVKARKSVESIELFDRIPMAAKLYEKAGMPHNFEEKLGRLSWKIERLNSGEERVFSYIIYSTVRIVGRLELAPATAKFIHEGKSSYVHSNRTYFVSDVQPRY